MTHPTPDPLREALERIDQLARLVAHDLQGRVEGGKVAAILRCADVARTALAAAPQPAPVIVGVDMASGPDFTAEYVVMRPAPADREALVEVLLEAYLCWLERPDNGHGWFWDEQADTLLARGLRLPGGDETMAWAAKVILSQPKRPDSPVADAFAVACAHLEDRECGAETTNEIIETFLKALAGADN